MGQINFISIIIAGITTGGLTCFAVQGGLLTSILTQIKKKEGEEKINELFPISAFIGAKIVVYTLLGALLGLFGSFFSINATLQAWIQILVSVYMIGVAMQLLNVHPIFRYFIIQPPQSLQRIVRKVSKGNDQITSPLLLGLLTVVIPCGTTLAMEALAISSGNPLTGALILFLFVISSSWIFFAVGLAATKITQSAQQNFYSITAIVLVVLGVMSFNGGLNLLGSPYSLESLLGTNEPKVLGSNNAKPVNTNETQKVTITIGSGGYVADNYKLKKGVPVELTLQSKNSYSCANAFTIPSLNIQKVLPPTGSDKVIFTPQKSGKLAYSCSMGMYRGNFIVE